MRHGAASCRIKAGITSNQWCTYGELVFFDIDVLPVCMQDRMLLEAFDPWPYQPAADSRRLENPGGIRLHLAVHLHVELRAFRTGWQGHCLDVKRIEGGRLIATVIALTGIGAIQQLPE